MHANRQHCTDKLNDYIAKTWQLIMLMPILVQCKVQITCSDASLWWCVCAAEQAGVQSGRAAAPLAPDVLPRVRTMYAHVHQ